MFTFNREIQIPQNWTIHSYYTICPYAPDGSGRLLLNCASFDKNCGEIAIVSKDGEILNRFGRGRLFDAFYHTGYWATWSPEADRVFFQAGTPSEPKIGVYDIRNDKYFYSAGDMEGAPPFGNPIYSGLMGMLYASGYSGGFMPEKSPVPFNERDKHGIFKFNLFENKRELILNISDILKVHPDREMLMELDEETKKENDSKYGLTLMAYCVRWNRAGNRMLFYFGNHCASRARKEPRIAYIFTADRNFNDICLAVGGRLCHWSWHPDNEHLIGYKEDGIYMIRYDGSGLRKISESRTMGHPSISHADYNTMVTDDYLPVSNVNFYDLKSGGIKQTINIPRINTEKEMPGRNRYRICTHPVFSDDGKKLLVNCLSGEYASVREYVLE